MSREQRMLDYLREHDMGVLWWCEEYTDEVRRQYGHCPCNARFYRCETDKGPVLLYFIGPRLNTGGPERFAQEDGYEREAARIANEHLMHPTIHSIMGMPQAAQEEHFREHPMVNWSKPIAELFPCEEKQGSMIVENVVQVLRMPDAPNAHYHEQCYDWDGSEVVLRVVRLIHDEQCAGCHGMVSETVVGGQVKVEQLALFA